MVFLREGTEDALHLNIYSPSFVHGGDVNGEPLPVMVFFHGGGYVSGSGSCLLYGPELLLDHEVICTIFHSEAGAISGDCGNS